MVKVFDENLIEKAAFQAQTDIITRIKQSPFNNYYVATTADEPVVKVWSISSTNWTLIRIYSNHTNNVVALEFINEDIIATGAYDYKIKL